MYRLGGRNCSASGDCVSSALVHKRLETHRKRRSVHSRPFSMFTANSGSSVPSTRCISGWTLSEESLSLVFSVGYVTMIHVAAESPRPSRTCRCRQSVTRKKGTTLNVCGWKCDARACACVCFNVSVCLWWCLCPCLCLCLWLCKACPETAYGRRFGCGCRCACGRNRARVGVRISVYALVIDSLAMLGKAAFGAEIVVMRPAAECWLL